MLKNSLFPLNAAILLVLLALTNCGDPVQDLGPGIDTAAIPVTIPNNPCTASGCIKNKPFFNIGHMANTKAAVDYSLRVGANAVEMDMNFAPDGTPTIFQHGLPCDCTCTGVLSVLTAALVEQPSICRVSENPCEGGSPLSVAEMFNYVASKPGLALVYFDSKITDIKDPNALTNAGQKVFDLIRNQLYNKGYKGQVIVSIPDRSSILYSKTVFSKLYDDPANADLRSSIFFGIDMEEDAYSTISFMRQNGFKGNAIYGTGITACSSETFYDQTATAASNLRADVIGLNIIWTLDKEASIRKYMELGATGIVSNNPERVTAMANAMGYKISPETRIPLGNDQVPVKGNIKGECDCDYIYKKGFLGIPLASGCKIVTPPPVGSLCDCSYKGAYTCGGSNLLCQTDDKNPACAAPSTGPASCRGDCQGY